MELWNYCTVCGKRLTYNYEHCEEDRSEDTVPKEELED